jgi:hypothetical protein
LEALYPPDSLRLERRGIGIPQQLISIFCQGNWPDAIDVLPTGFMIFPHDAYKAPRFRTLQKLEDRCRLLRVEKLHEKIQAD